MSATGDEEDWLMVTVVTHVRVKQGHGPDWDRAFSERVEAAVEKEGFVEVQLCKPREADEGARVIIGTWQREEDWEAWHHDPEFVETRRELEEAADGTEASHWYDVIISSRG